MGNVVGFAIEALVAVLLVATIVYCAMLDRRLKRLRMDEADMRGTISELVSATHAAERAIAALRDTVGQCEETLADRLGRAERLSKDMAGQLGEGEAVIERIARIAKAAREHGARVEGAQRPDAGAADPVRRRAEPEPALTGSAATAAAAEMFAQRIRALSLGGAAS